MASTWRRTSLLATCGCALACAFSSARGFLRAWFRSTAWARARATTCALCASNPASSFCSGCRSRPVGAARCSATPAPAPCGSRSVASSASSRRSGASPTRTCSQASTPARARSTEPASTRLRSICRTLLCNCSAGPNTVSATAAAGWPRATGTVSASSGSCRGPVAGVQHGRSGRGTVIGGQAVHVPQRARAQHFAARLGPPVPAGIDGAEFVRPARSLAERAAGAQLQSRPHALGLVPQHLLEAVHQAAVHLAAQPRPARAHQQQHGDQHQQCDARGHGPLGDPQRPCGHSPRRRHRSSRRRGFRPRAGLRPASWRAPRCLSPAHRKTRAGIPGHARSAVAAHRRACGGCG